LVTTNNGHLNSQQIFASMQSNMAQSLSQQQQQPQQQISASTVGHTSPSGGVQQSSSQQLSLATSQPPLTPTSLPTQPPMQNLLYPWMRANAGTIGKTSRK
jgi:hypothetical protein